MTFADSLSRAGLTRIAFAASTPVVASKTLPVSAYKRHVSASGFLIRQTSPSEIGRERDLDWKRGRLGIGCGGRH
jgi:hypothetical protein